MFDTGHDLSSRSTIAPQLVCDDHTRTYRNPFKSFRKNFFVPALLNQNIQYVTIVIYGTPEVLELSVDLLGKPHPSALVAGTGDL